MGLKYITTRTNEEIDDVLNRCNEKVDEGGSRFFGMTYEQGIVAGIDWLLGNTDDHPYDDEA
jgi:hypothetical protein